MRSVEQPWAGLPPEGRERLRELARPVRFEKGRRLFEEGGHADRFWWLAGGRVTLDVRVPGRRAAMVAEVGAGELLGWSWLFPPYTWHLGAEAVTRVEAEEFDATVVRSLCEADPATGRAVYREVAGLLAQRLQRSRARLLDLYAPYGSGPGE
ncbi:regulator protein [Streptomyces albus]|uniref:Regulator protein n=1 Tax=Streptomyces albus (strain ATCC 21838 / DSM 41398 / FERM P-419 / JCM 4703 / NBRC 107858) TaxID=1081613 RepID=A0A0B5F8M5_STRA4|nr:regulator protein [Streptomyces albus]AOU81535.1 regulator protein [Streptomyces albus]AYN37229.1 hypothetical protein DUI70_6736 [Streptomyces albus]